MMQCCSTLSVLLLLALLTTTACGLGGEEGVCYGIGTDGKDHCWALTKKRACVAEKRTWAPYLPGDKAQRHWETSGIRTCNGLGYASCGPGGCSRQ